MTGFNKGGYEGKESRSGAFGGLAEGGASGTESRFDIQSPLTQSQVDVMYGMSGAAHGSDAR
jgi:hypothetical protein